MDISIIGAGPVGLTAAAELTQNGNNITVYEKRADYTRRQVVRLKPADLNHLTTTRDIFKSKIAICDLETQLRERAQECGVIFEHKEITDIRQIKDKIIIMTTGSKSALRDNIFGAPIHLLEPKTVVVVSYKVNNRARRTPFLAWYRTIKVLEGVAIEQINRDTVILLWEPPEFDNHELRRRIQFWINLRGDNIVQDTIKYQSYKSVIYQMPEFATEYAGKIIFLAGDAAAGVPYFRSLQMGLENIKYLSGSGLNVNKYNSIMNTATDIQTGIGFSSSLVLNLSAFYLRISRYSPFQINKWSETYINELSNKEVVGLQI